MNTMNIKNEYEEDLILDFKRCNVIFLLFLVFFWIHFLRASLEPLHQIIRLHVAIIIVIAVVD